MENVYVELHFSHKSFTTGRTAIVAVPNKCEYLTTYIELAKEKVCEKLNLNKNEVVVFNHSSVLGRDVLFIDINQ